MVALKQILFPTLGLSLLFLCGVGVRRHVLAAQHKGYEGDLPFTLESALFFHRIEQIREQGSLPEVDYDIQYPDGIVLAETYSLGAETLFARLERLLPQSWSLTERIRWIACGWFCLGIPLVALWIRWWLGSWSAAFVSGSFYAVSLSAVIRSTGQELLRENVALPLLIAHLAVSALANRVCSLRRKDVLAVLSAVSLCLALVCWDLVQYYLILWMTFWFICLVVNPVSFMEKESRSWIIHFASLIAVGLFNGYLSAHEFLRSPSMLLGFGMFLCLLVLLLRCFRTARSVQNPDVPRALTWRSKWLLPCLGLLPIAVETINTGVVVTGSYAHFWDLIVAKIRFLNNKPADPSLLNFNQRIMWVPALHSASLRSTFMLFPAAMVLTLLACIVHYLYPNRLSDSRVHQLITFYVISLISYCLFVRFHVFLALFSAGLLGLLTNWTIRLRSGKRILLLSLVVLGLFGEAAHALTRPQRWGRTWVYYKELEELAEWFKALAEPAPVLASFGVGCSILAYGGCPIILHPKFESREIRERVRSYGENLFTQTEKEFRDWADLHHVVYYVHSLGQFSDVAPDRQMRYFVNTLDPPEFAAARVFEYQPEKSKYFRTVWENRKYRVFRMVTKKEESFADWYSKKAWNAFERGDLEVAERYALKSLKLFSHQVSALKLMRHVGSLRDQGFSSGH